MVKIMLLYSNENRTEKYTIIYVLRRSTYLIVGTHYSVSAKFFFFITGSHRSAISDIDNKLRFCCDIDNAAQ